MVVTDHAAVDGWGSVAHGTYLAEQQMKFDDVSTRDFDDRPLSQIERKWVMDNLNATLLAMGCRVDRLGTISQVINSYVASESDKLFSPASFRRAERIRHKRIESPEHRDLMDRLAISLIALGCPNYRLDDLQHIVEDTIDLMPPKLFSMELLSKAEKRKSDDPELS